MVRFAEVFPDEPIVSALRRQLTWTHLKRLIYIDDPLKRDFYTEMCRLEHWSLLKRTLKGAYVSVEPFHLFRYLDEEAFRFNRRRVTDGERFRDAVQSISGKRLTYQKLTGECVS